MCISYRYQMRCGHTDAIPAACEFREEGVKDWRGKKHSCLKKIVCGSDYSQDCMACCNQSRGTLIDTDVPEISWDLYRDVSYTDLSTMQVIVRNEGFLRRRKMLRPLSPFVPPSNNFNPLSPDDLQLQFLVNEAFLRKRQSRKALQAHLNKSLKEDDSEESYQFFCEKVERFHEAQLALTNFREELNSIPEPQPVRSIGTQASLMSENKEAENTEAEFFLFEQGVVPLTLVESVEATSSRDKGKGPPAENDVYSRFQDHIHDTVQNDKFENANASQEEDDSEQTDGSQEDGGSQNDDAFAGERPQSRLENRTPVEDFYFNFQRTLVVEAGHGDKKLRRPASRLENRPFDTSLLSYSTFEISQAAHPPPQSPHELAFDLSLRSAHQPTIPQRTKFPLGSAEGQDALHQVRQYLSMPDCFTPSEIFEWGEDNPDVFDAMQEGKQKLTPSRIVRGQKGRAYWKAGRMVKADDHTWSLGQDFLHMWESLDWDELSPFPPSPSSFDDSDSSSDKEGDEILEATLDMDPQASSGASRATSFDGALSILETLPFSPANMSNAASSDGYVFLEETVKPKADEHKSASQLSNKFSHGNSRLRTVITIVREYEIAPQAISLRPSSSPPPSPKSVSPASVTDDEDIDSVILSTQSTLSALATPFTPICSRVPQLRQEGTPRQKRRKAFLENERERRLSRRARKRETEEQQKEDLMPIPNHGGDDKQAADSIISLTTRGQLQPVAPLSLPIQEVFEQPVSYTTSNGAVLLTRIRNLLDLPREFAAADVSSWIDANAGILQSIREGRALLPLDPGEGGYRDEGRSELFHAIENLDWDEIDDKRGMF